MGSHSTTSVTDDAYTDVKMTLEDEYGDYGTRLYTSFYNVDQAEETTAHWTLQHITRITGRNDRRQKEYILLMKLSCFLLGCAMQAQMKKMLVD
ncbi:hypothetical protein PRIPAC_70831 [Pristionchus pacificus]|uniref:Uncharacterized protein n=1 Tax=Pristionchus pacificus TaxID=54126 RepID=A0A2A6BF57_PRIPA|nr:hypothetical protein PRIPAC_70831 [Pristionchus pacificus]|eukprot:PDM64522.1 hypothetical protein PRIPAC_52778 [Pristionchus pacificus]